MQRTEWNEEFLRELLTGNFAKYPNEVMLKVIFGSYLEKPLQPKANWKVLDIGCAFGNNLIPFADLGCDVHGVDIHPGIAANAQKIMNARGYHEVTFSEGTNQKIPYPDNHFDLILSINTIHYESSESELLKALAEFHRVLKVGGACYLSTVGPEHEIYRRAEFLGEHINVVQNFGFRDGERLFFFDNERYLKYYLSKYFTDVETGKVTEKLMTLPLEFLVAVARKA
jgi:SAM-dependent methyltransferase